MWPVPGLELPHYHYDGFSFSFFFLDKSKGCHGYVCVGGGVLYESVSLLICDHLQIYLYVKRKSIHADFHKCEIRFASTYLSM